MVSELVAAEPRSRTPSPLDPCGAVLAATISARALLGLECPRRSCLRAVLPLPQVLSRDQIWPTDPSSRELREPSLSLWPDHKQPAVLVLFQVAAGSFSPADSPRRWDLSSDSLHPSVDHSVLFQVVQNFCSWRSLQQIVRSVLRQSSAECWPLCPVASNSDLNPVGIRSLSLSEFI